MKYIAINLVFFLAVTVTYAENKVDCPPPRPPGGDVTCPNNLAPICMIRDGYVSAKCVGAPTSFATYQEKLRFLETHFQYSFGGLPQGQIDQILIKGEIKTADGMRATFKLPTK